jgi:hypothetical protein
MISTLNLCINPYYQTAIRPTRKRPGCAEREISGPRRFAAGAWMDNTSEAQ